MFIKLFCEACVYYFSVKKISAHPKCPLCACGNDVRVK